MAEAVGTEDWNASRLAVDRPALSGDPDVEVEKSRCVQKGRCYLTFDGNGVRSDFLVEGLAERDRVV